MKQLKETLQYIKFFREDISKCLKNSDSEQWKLVYAQQVLVMDLIIGHIEGKIKGRKK